MDREPRWRSALVALAALSLTLPASARAQASDLGVRTEIEDDGGHALDAFHEALGRAERGEGRARVVVWGASHVASDQLTGVLREHLQTRFGDAGPGFVMPARPFHLYAHRRATVAEIGAWRALRVSGRVRTPGHYGLMGVALVADRPAIAEVRTRQPVDRARVFLRRRADGGAVRWSVGSGPPSTVSTRGSPGVLRLDVTPEGGLRELRLTTSGTVRLFGVSLERDQPGVIVDSMGVPGARLRDRLPWRDDSFRTQLDALGPDLIVLAYGTNESGFAGRPIRRYEREVDDAVRRARNAAPGASCVLIGPSDWPTRNEDGTRSARPRTQQIVRVQREVARARGCGFFDLVHAQGGPGSMGRWVDAGRALFDHVHFTDEGHEILGRELYRALIAGYATRSDDQGLDP